MSRLALLAVILLAATLRFVALDTQPLWIDEAFSLWLAEQPVPQLVSEVARLDQHPPLYYLLLHQTIAALGRTEFALRVTAALVSVATVPLLYVSGVRLHGKRAGLVAALLLALSPLQIRYAQEARMYAPLTLAVAASLYCFTRLADARPASLRSRLFSALGLTFSLAATLYLHNVGVLWLAALGTSSLAIARRSPSRATWLLATLAAALLLWLPWLPHFLQQAAAVEGRFWIAPLTPLSVLTTLGAIALVAPGAWGTPTWLLPTLSLALCLALATLAVRSQRAVRPLVILFGLPVGLALLVSLHRSIWATHVLLWLVVPLLLLVAVGAATLARRWRGAALGLLCTLALFSLSHDFAAAQRGTPKEAWPQAAAHVASHAAPGDLLLFQAGWSRLPFAYYFQPLDAPSVDSYSLPDGLFARNEIEPLFIAADLPALRAQIACRERVWLIYTHAWYSDPHELALHALQQQMRLVEQQSFPGIDVYLFEQP